MGGRTQRACPRCPRSPAGPTPFPPEASSRAGSTLAQTPTCPTLLSDKDMMRKLSCNLMNVCYFALLDSILPDTDIGHPSRLDLVASAGVCSRLAQGLVQRPDVVLCVKYIGPGDKGRADDHLVPDLLEGVQKVEGRCGQFNCPVPLSVPCLTTTSLRSIRSRSKAASPRCK